MSQSVIMRKQKKGGARRAPKKLALEPICWIGRLCRREIKSYWTLRLKWVKTPFRVILRSRMTPPIPVLTALAHEKREKY